MEHSLQQAITEQWLLTEMSSSVLLQDSGRPVYRFQTEQGTWVVKTADVSKGQEAMKQDTKLLHWLEEQQYPTVRLLPTKTGALFGRWQERFITITAYIPSTEPQPTLGNWHSLGCRVGQLHTLPTSANTAGAGPQNIWPQPAEFGFADEIAAMGWRACQSPIDPLYRQMVEALPAFALLPQGMIHGDCSLHNSVLRQDKQIVLVDWDSAGCGSFLLDLAFPMVFCYMQEDHEQHSDWAEAYFAGYLQYRRPSSQEWAQLFDAALFYVLSYCIEDWAGYRVNAGRWQVAQDVVAGRGTLEAKILEAARRAECKLSGTMAVEEAES